MKQSKSGFTIVEIIIVVVVIGILASIVIIGYNQVQARGRDSKRKADVSNIIKALELYYADNGSYPIASGTTSIKGPIWYTSGDSSWSTLSSTLTNAKAIDSVPTDPINTPSGYPDGANMYTYGLYVNDGSYCGAAPGKMYILIYRLESQAKESATDGSCATNELGSGYLAAGASFYRSIH